jgi:hypothetical protein
MSKSIVAGPDSKLLGLQVDLLQKISSGNRTLEELEWFLKLPKRKLFAMMGVLTFNINIFHEQSWMYPGLATQIIRPYDFQSEILSADISRGVRSWWVKSMKVEDVGRDSRYGTADPEDLLILLYLLVVHPDYGRAVLNFHLDTSKEYIIFRTTESGGEIVLKYEENAWFPRYTKKKNVHFLDNVTVISLASKYK